MFGFLKQLFMAALMARKSFSAFDCSVARSSDNHMNAIHYTSSWEIG